MGAYLSEPIREKHSESGENTRLRYGATACQGWRITQEDAHNCILDLDSRVPDCSLFAVYDGHGGSDVSEFTAKNFPSFLTELAAWKDGDYNEALKSAFISFDAKILEAEVLNELQAIADRSKNEEDQSSSSDETENERNLLMEEAYMPLHAVLRNYGILEDVSTEQLKRALNNEKKRPGKSRRRGVESSGDKESDASDKPVFTDISSAPAEEHDTNHTNSQSEKVLETTNGELDRAHSPQSPQMTVDNDSSIGAKSPCSSPPKKRHKSDADSNAPSSIPNASDGHVNDESDPKKPLEVNGVTHGLESASKTTDPKPATACKEVKHSQDRVTKDEILERIGELFSRSKSADVGEVESVDSVVAHLEGVANGVFDPSLPYLEMLTWVVAGGHDFFLNSEKLSSMYHLVGDSYLSCSGPTTTADCESSHLHKCARAYAASLRLHPGNKILKAYLTDTVGVKDPFCPTSIQEALKRHKKAEEKKVLVTDNSIVNGESESSSDDEFRCEEEESVEEKLKDMGDNESDDSEETSSVEALPGDEEDSEMDSEESEEAVESIEEDEEIILPSGDKPGFDSGTTACVAILIRDDLYVVNVGDSRCVLCRGGTAVDLSVDHKPEDVEEQARIERAGGKVTSDGRVNGGLNLSRAIGDHFYKQNESLSLAEQMITAHPDVKVERLQPEDAYFVLACDGIWNSMTSQEVVDFVSERRKGGVSLEKICEELCESCIAPNTMGDGTGCDNMTAIIVELLRDRAPVKKTEDSSEDQAL